MTLKILFIYWPLLSFALAAVLCRLIHNSKVAVRALEVETPQQQALEQQGEHDSNAPRHEFRA